MLECFCFFFHWPCNPLEVGRVTHVIMLFTDHIFFNWIIYFVVLTTGELTLQKKKKQPKTKQISLALKWKDDLGVTCKFLKIGKAVLWRKPGGFKPEHSDKFFSLSALWIWGSFVPQNGCNYRIELDEWFFTSQNKYNTKKMYTFWEKVPGISLQWIHKSNIYPPPTRGIRAWIKKR